MFRIASRTALHWMPKLQNQRATMIRGSVLLSSKGQPTTVMHLTYTKTSVSKSSSAKETLTLTSHGGLDNRPHTGTTIFIGRAFSQHSYHDSTLIFNNCSISALCSATW